MGGFLSRLNFRDLLSKFNPLRLFYRKPGCPPKPEMLPPPIDEFEEQQIYYTSEQMFSHYLMVSRKMFMTKFRIDYKAPPADIDDFKLIGLFPAGRFGKVIYARQRSEFHRPVVIKVVSRDSLDPEEMTYIDLSIEAKILSSIHFPFIVSLHYCFEDIKSYYLVMDFIPGGELHSYLITHREIFDSYGVLFYSAQVIMCLEYLHSVGIVYRDLKLENLILDEEGYLKLVDFGLSMQVGDKPLRGRCGTTEYMSPETINLSGTSFPSDWWSLGVMMYELAVGITPFYSELENEIYENILNGTVEYPQDMDSCLKSLVKNLLKVRVEKRLGTVNGSEEIKKHLFFSNLNWITLYEKKLEAPIIPPPFDEDVTFPRVIKKLEPF